MEILLSGENNKRNKNSVINYLLPVHDLCQLLKLLLVWEADVAHLFHIHHSHNELRY